MKVWKLVCMHLPFDWIGNVPLVVSLALRRCWTSWGLFTAWWAGAPIQCWRTTHPDSTWRYFSKYEPPCLLHFTFHYKKLGNLFSKMNNTSRQANKINQYNNRRIAPTPAAYQDILVFFCGFGSIVPQDAIVSISFLCGGVYWWDCLTFFWREVVSWLTS